jgi:surfeit locus 1 family protein
MVFRPYPVLTLGTAAILGALLWLGVWQLGRADWKRSLIAVHEAALKADPVPLAEALCRPSIAEPAPIIARAEAEALAAPESRVIRMFGRGPEGEPGWRRLVLIRPPACAASAGPLLAELSFEALQTVEYPIGGVRTPDRLVLTPWPPKAPFATFNDIANNDWHWFDAAAIANELDAPDLDRTRFLAASSAAPAHLRTPPAQHLGYAATWFGMAVALLVVYVVMHVRTGRLRLGGQSAGPT